jgi:hypothetical protein
MRPWSARAWAPALALGLLGCDEGAIDLLSGPPEASMPARPACMPAPKMPGPAGADDASATTPMPMPGMPEPTPMAMTACDDPSDSGGDASLVEDAPGTP